MFIAHLKQIGEDCDYTIACGEKLILLKSDFLYDALKELKELLIGDPEIGSGEYSYYEFETVTFYTVSHTQKIDIKSWYKERQDAAEKFDAEQTEREERELLEKLSKKYGGSK